MNIDRNILQQIAPYSADVLDPFVMKQKLTILDKIKVAVMTVIALPVKLSLTTIVLAFGWLISVVTIKGLPEEEENNEKPISGWRRKYAKPFIVSLCRLAFVFAGWNWITLKGKQASTKEAPILLLVPHTSFLDTIPLATLGYPCLVVKDGTKKTPIFSTLIKYTQPVYVKRNDPSSCQSTIDEIRRRAISEDNWEQIVIFPEGTCGNRQALLDFKKGAFYPGVPIQPVFIRYPNRLDTVTWAWDGPGALRQIWLSLCQFHIYCEMEFLPVYKPSEIEKENPRIFAKNMRQFISKHVGIPLSNFALEDIKYLNLVTQKKLPRTVGLVKLLKLRKKLGHETMDVTNEISNVIKRMTLQEAFCSLTDFGRYVNSPVSEALKDFFYLMDQEEKGIIDGRIYIAGLWLLNCKIDEWKRLENSFQVFDKEGLVTQEQFAAIALLWRGIPISVSYDAFQTSSFKCKEKKFSFGHFQKFMKSGLFANSTGHFQKFIKSGLFANNTVHKQKGTNGCSVTNGASKNYTKQS